MLLHNFIKLIHDFIIPIHYLSDEWGRHGRSIGLVKGSIDGGEDLVGSIGLAKGSIDVGWFGRAAVEQCSEVGRMSCGAQGWSGSDRTRSGFLQQPLLPLKWKGGHPRL